MLNALTAQILITTAVPKIKNHDYMDLRNEA